MSKAFIQIQDLTGNWRTVATVLQQDQIIKTNLDSTVKQYKKTARAVDDKGNLLQLSN